jgi:hypothetical protein
MPQEPIMNLRALALGCLVALAAPACSSQNPVEEETGAAASAAAATKISAAVGSLTLTFDTMSTFEDRAGGRALILHATANRYLKNVFSFVPDDAFGQANIISERRLEIVLYEGHEVNTLLSGLPLFLTVETFTGTPTLYTAQVKIEPQFYYFLGSTSIWIDEPVRPVYAVNGTDTLVYRGAADALADQLTVTAPDGAPTVTRVDADSFRLDWLYPALYLAVDPHTTPLTFTADLSGGGGTVEKTARLVTRVVGLELTTDDPYAVWPTPECDPAVFACYNDAPMGTTDFGSCGTYREVSRCVYADECDVMPPAPLSLAPIDASSLEPARVAWNQGPNGYTWHNLATLVAYDTPECPAVPVTIEAVVEKLAETEQQQSQPQSSTFTDRNGLAQSLFFGSGYGDGAALLAAIDAFAGGGAIQAYLSTDEVPCQNCHDFAERAVLYYPDSGVVVVLDGNYGYDS